MRKEMLSLATATAVGTATLIPPASWWPWVRKAYVVVPGVLVGAGGVLLFAVHVRDDMPDDSGVDQASGAGIMSKVGLAPPSGRLAASLAASLAVGAAFSAGQAGTLRADAAIERWLVRRGLAHPRRWMAGAAALVVLANDVRDNLTRRSSGAVKPLSGPSVTSP